MLDIYKGVPQGSTWNCGFQCLYQWYFPFCKKNRNLHNYADDNTPSKSDTFLATITKSPISSFSSNKMQANPENVQAIAIGNKTHKQNIAFNVNGNNIKCDEEVELLGVLLGVTIDF